MNTVAAAGLAALCGAVLGVLLAAMIARLPAGESLLRPPPWTGAGARLPLVVGLTAALFALVPLVLGTGPVIWAGFMLLAVLVPCTFIDLDHRIIPNAITYPAAPAALVLIAVTQTDALKEHVLAGVGALLFLGIAAFINPAGMGMGDVKLVGVMGLLLGREIVPALAVALLAGTVVGFALIARKGREKGRQTFLPFGPFLALGGLVGLYAGDALIDLYRGQ